MAKHVLWILCLLVLGHAGCTRSPDENAPSSGGDGGAGTSGEGGASSLGAPRGHLAPIRKEGDAARPEGLTRTASGLEYAVVHEGSGPKPPSRAIVRVHHTGWTVRGDRLARRFADSRESGRPEEFVLAPEAPEVARSAPAAFTLGQKPPRPVYLQGWREALADMRPGERRWLVVPSGLAYGSLGFDDLVPPGADLAFDIELVDFRAE